MKKFLSIILAILMVVTMIPLSVLPASAAGTFVEDIAIAADADKATAQGKLTSNGYTLIDVDLNKGCGSGTDYIYIGYKTTTKPNKAIRSILFLTPYEGEIREGWLSNKSAYHYPIGCSEMPNGSGDGFVNLNNKAGGTQLYMYVSREIRAGAPLTEMMINGSSSQSGYSTAVYVFSEAAQNLNEGTSGDALYLHYKDAPEYSGLDYQDFNDLYLELESYLYKDSVAEDVKQAVREALVSYDEVIELNFANEKQYVYEYTIYIRQTLRDLQSYIVAEESDFAAIDASLVNLDSVLAGVSVSDIITQEAASIKADLAAYRADPNTTKADVASLQERIDTILTVVNNCKNGQHEWSDVDGSCLYGCGAVCSHDAQSGTCGICGAEIHTCDFSGKWNSDPANHWKQCACGKTAQQGAHTWSNGVCLTCSYACTHPAYDASKNCTVCGSACAHSFTNGFCSVNGCYEAPVLKDGYYQIDNAGKLFWFANYVNTVDRTANAVLTADIDLENRPWTPIGSTGENSNNFRGIFDGQNHTIKGLYVEGGRAGLGFFGEVRTGTVKNFTIFGEVVVNTEVDYIGGVIGSVCGVNGENDLERNGAIIQNVTSYVNLTAKAHGIGMIGGFVGYANHQSLIENCTWYGTFDAGIYRVDSGAGGFIGKIQENTSEVTIRNCGAYGTIKTNYAKNSYNNTATIYMGGFLSFTNTNAKTVLENCLFAGQFERGDNLTDQALLGAFGTVRSVNAIKNCYYLGDDGLEAVHSDSPLKPGSGNVEITKVTEEQLKSGEIAYKLGDAWGQTIGTDDDPVLGGEEVYYGYVSCADDAVAVYSNNSKASATKPAHDWSDKNGICANGCGSKCIHAGQTGEICTLCGGNTDGCYFDKNGFCSCGKYQQPTGSGTESDPYKISNAGQLYWFATAVNGFDLHIEENPYACAELTSDIIINENVLNEDGSLNTANNHREWIAIGYHSGSPYFGSFDGKNFTISGVYDSTCVDTTMSGLFGYLGEGGKISNVTLSDSYINGVFATGGIVGWNEGTVTDCRNDGLVCAADLVGGVVGVNNNIVSNCHNTGTVRFNNDFDYGDGDTIGGVVGSNNGTLTHCSNTGNVEGNDMYIGGIAGSNDGTLIHCSNTGNVSGHSLVGGVVGHNDGIVTFCSNTATVKGTNTESYYIGGVAGHNLNTVKSSYNTGEVIGRLWIGGIAGANPKNTVISDCFNTGMVKCTTSNVNVSEFVGGISGNNYGTVTACYYLTGTAAGGIARKDIAGQAEVKTAEQFASGDVAYFLQGEQAEQVWGQKIGTDAMPVFGGDKVYGGYTTCKDDASMVFTNKAGEVPAEKPAHDWSNKDGICANCGKECAHEDQTGAICGICGGELHVCSFTNNGICSCGVFEPATGSGTESDPYLISNAGQLYWFSAIVSTGYGDVAKNKAACAELTADITVNNNVLNEDGTLNGVGSDYRAWNRIGDDDYIYTGTFDGNHFTVSGLYIKKYENHVGLFGYVGQGGKVSNLTLADSYIFGSSYVGLVGTNYGTVQNCRNTGRMEAYYIVAGVAGENRGTVKNCSNNGWIQSYTGIGGVVCYNYGTVEDCYNAGSVTKTSKGSGMGGVACKNNGTIVNCYNIGTLTIVSGDDVGGVVCYPAENSTLTNCYYLAGTAEGGINGADAAGQAEVKTAEQFASGEVAYLLQGARTEQVWGQTIGTEASPVLGGDKVYGGYTTCKDEEMVYTNNASDVSAEKPAHNWSNLDGVCANGCGAKCAHENQTGSVCEVCGVTLHTCDFSGDWVYDNAKHWKECTADDCDKISEKTEHEFMDGECTVCDYVCDHANATSSLIRPVQNADGTWGQGSIVTTCPDCGNVDTEFVNRADYTAFDAAVEELSELLAKADLIDGPKQDYTSTLSAVMNGVSADRIESEQSTVSNGTQTLNNIISTIKAGLADNTMKKADLSYMTALLDEVNALIDSNPNNIIPTESGKYYGPNNYHKAQLNNGNFSQAAHDSNMVTYDYENQLETLLAGLKDGSMRKADYSVIDEVIAGIDEALETATVSDEMQAELDGIKKELDALKSNAITSVADLANSGLLARAEAIAETMNNCANGVHVFTNYEVVDEPACEVEGKKVAVCDNGCGATDEREIPALTHEPLEAVKENEVAPKCGVAGSYDLVVYCDICGEELDRDTITVDALEHSFTKYEVTEEAKCGVAGKEVATCDNGCGATDEKENPALTHKDDNGDYKCDYGCGHEFENPVGPEQPDTPDEPEQPDEPTDEICAHICHSGNTLMRFFWKIIRFFQKLFGIQQYCDCGVTHW
ncbi:MAG: hypothetical protein E7523_01385 [Ruminococcaceae bacterium]|nr:hypothetical protein [Oscillospiraceae bacterium]